MPSIFWLIVGILCCWRITHLLEVEEGPWRAVARWRRVMARLGAGGAIGCFYCLSVWVAAPLAWALSPSWKERLIQWGALSGGAILLERITEPRAPQTAFYTEQKGEPADE